MQIPLPTSTPIWIPTRAEAVQRMTDFIPRAGRTYAAERNYDRGPAERGNVSTLSPYLRNRAITESELLAAVLARFSLSSAEKFVQEIFWRTYWKGWLESHPSAWTRYRSALDDVLADLDGDARLGAAHDAAVNGRTGIDAFDAWARELIETNYLHNHARMWFASIWIFTLELPWELGADFFMRNLLDGDPASNTLSWRWVAGLQTRGKTYTATRDNIRRYTEGRFALERPLVRATQALDEPALPAEPLPELPSVAGGDEAGLLVLHEDDLHGDLGNLPAAGIRGVCAVPTAAGRSPRPLNPAVPAFTDVLAVDAVSRAAGHLSAADLGRLEAGEDVVAIGAAIVAAAARCGATRVLAPFAPVGPARDLLLQLAVALPKAGLGYTEFGRRYDAVSWPAATRGFFNLRARIPTILAELGIGAG